MINPTDNKNAQTLNTWPDVADYSLEQSGTKSKHSPLDVKKFLTGRHRPGPMELNIRSTR